MGRWVKEGEGGRGEEEEGRRRGEGRRGRGVGGEGLQLVLPTSFFFHLLSTLFARLKVDLIFGISAFGL